MIQYPVSLRALARIIAVRLPTTRNTDDAPRKNARIAWRTRARELTRRLRAGGSYSREEEIWSELNRVFADLQGGGKCAYCEKKLDLHRSGRVAGDIEHYRPKGGVVAWPTTHPISTGGNAPGCYYLLAFYLRNYLLACSVCNQDYKRNYFPIAGPRCAPTSTRSRDLKAELPYLPHPLDPDDDPELIIEFFGIVPVPRVPKGTHEYWRAVVTIELLGLTAGNRFDLDLQRAHVIATLYLAFTSNNSADPIVQRMIRGLQDNTLPHRNCARSFKRVFDADPARASQLAIEATQFVDAVRHRRRQNP